MAVASNPQLPDALRNNDSIPARVLKQKVWRRMNVQNEHFMGAIVGREGKAKSHTGLKICSVVDPTFNAERVFFDPTDFLEAVDEADSVKGKMFMFDEAGAGMGNRTWYEKGQILLNQSFQTIRDENAGLIFTLPRLSELDSQAIGRLHAFIEMYKKNEKEGYALGRWKNISPTRDERSKIYKKYPKMRWNGRVRRIRSLAFSPPDPDLVAEYQPRKDAFKKELYKKTIAESRGENDADFSPKDAVEEIKADARVDDFVGVHGGNGMRYIDADLIEMDFGCSHRDAEKVKKLLDRDEDINITDTEATA